MSRQETLALVEGTNEIDEGVKDQGRRKALAEAADTQRSCSLGARPILLQQPPHGLPGSIFQALEYLQFLLDNGLPSNHDNNTSNTNSNTNSSSNSSSNSLVYDVMKVHLEKGDLHTFLLTQQLCRLGDDHDGKNNYNMQSLPNDLLYWFLLVSSTTSNNNNDNNDNNNNHVAMDNLARGAYYTLSKLWMDFRGYPEEGYMLSFDDLPIQLKDWFGLQPTNVTQPKSHKTNNNNSTSQESKEAALTRFLHLWDIAFAQKLVHIDPKTVLDQASKSLRCLLLVGLDPVFESPKM